MSFPNKGERPNRRHSCFYKDNLKDAELPPGGLPLDNYFAGFGSKPESDNFTQS